MTTRGFRVKYARALGRGRWRERAPSLPDLVVSARMRQEIAIGLSLGERREIDRESIDLLASGTLQKMPTLGVLIPSLRS